MQKPQHEMQNPLEKVQRASLAEELKEGIWVEGEEGGAAGPHKGPRVQ